MHALDSETNVPWHRVINAQGRVSLGDLAGRAQRALLENEGVVFDGSGKVDLARFRWRPRSR